MFKLFPWLFKLTSHRDGNLFVFLTDICQEFLDDLFYKIYAKKEIARGILT